MPSPRQAVRWPAAVLGLLLCCDPALPRKGHEGGLTAAAPGPSESPAAGERRRAERLASVARARESEGKVREALDAYLALTALDGREVLLPLPGEPAVKVSPAVLARAGVAGMLAKADDKKKKLIAGEVRRRWEALKGRADVGALRAFVAVFGPETAEGRAARLRLADLLARKASFRAAELLLEEVRRHPGDARSAGRAVLGLAKVCARERLLADAIYYYDVLARDFGKAALVGGQTGSDLRDELATDKRFVPYLDSKPDFPSGKFRVVAREERDPYPDSAPVYRFTHAGEPLPFFRRYDLAVHFGADETDVVDRTTAGWLKRASVPGGAFRRVVTGAGAAGRAKFSYQTLAHLGVLPLGDRVLGIDPVGRRTLWQRDISGAGKEGAPEPKAVTFRPRDGAVQVSYAGGWSQRLGVVLPLSPDAMCVPGREGLLCLDPLTGRTRWLRTDVKPDAHVFGDAQTVFAVEVGARGSASSTRAFRVADGSALKMPDFRKEYDRRVRVPGGRLLLSEKGAKGEVILSLYDPLSGKSPWRQTYPARSVVLDAVDTDLAGVVAPDGTVHVIDPRTGKGVFDAPGRKVRKVVRKREGDWLDRLLRSGPPPAPPEPRKVDPKHLKAARAVHLLAERDFVYLAINRPPSKDVLADPEEGVRPGFEGDRGVRWLPVNGAFYAFERGTGELRWRNNAEYQTLTLTHFKDMPVLLLTARYAKWVGARPERRTVKMFTGMAWDKRNGKLVWETETIPLHSAFHTLSVRPDEWSVDLVGPVMEVRFRVEPRR